MRQHAANKLTGHFQRVHWMGIENGNDGEDGRARICSLLHVAEMNFVEWSFADAKGEGPSFFQADVGGTCDEIVSEGPFAMAASVPMLQGKTRSFHRLRIAAACDRRSDIAGRVLNDLHAGCAEKF